MRGGRRGIHFSKSEMKNLGNPFRFNVLRRGRRILILPVFTVCILGVTVLFYWLFFTPAFAITSVHFQSGISLPTETISQMVQEQLNSTRLRIFPQANLFGFDVSVFSKALKNQFALEHVSVARKRPHTLLITIAEKPREAIWSTRGKFYALDASGVLQGQIGAPRDTKIPVIYDQSGGAVEEHALVLDPSMLQFIAKVLHDPVIESLGPQLVLVPTAQSTDIMVKVKEGWKLHLTKAASLESQLANLNLTLNNSVAPEKRNKLEYIDVRFSERVYVKYR